MATNNANPNVSLELSRNEFNSLVSLLDVTYENNIEKLSDWARELKGKMIAHSFVKDDKASTRFFAKEAAELIYILFTNSIKVSIKDDYFEIMKEDFNERQKEYKARHAKKDE